MSNMNETSIKWKNEFSKTLSIFTQERDTILLKNTDIMTDIIDYEWVYRMPLLRTYSVIIVDGSVKLSVKKYLIRIATEIVLQLERVI